MKGKKFLAILGIFSLAVLSFGLAAIGATSADVTATVTPGVISVSVSPGTVAYGTVGVPTTDNIPTGDTIINADNNGNIPENFLIKGANATGGTVTWNITTGAPSGASGTPAYGYNHKFMDCGSDSGCSAPALANTMDTTSETLATNVSATGDRYFKLRLSTPTETGGDTTQHSTSVTLTAVAY